MAHLALRLLGALEIRLDDTPVTDRVNRKARALLVYLAIEAGRPHRRDSLAALLWPDWPERSARTNLRNTLSELRAAIGDRDAQTPCLLVTRETIQFNQESDHWVDASAFDALVAAFSALADQGDILEQAVALYRGPYLEGFTVESPAFEDWARGVRDRLERQALDALQALTEGDETRGEYARAREHAQRRIELAPWQERAHRDVMRLLALSGERGSALAQYEACRRALREELDVEPGEATTRLYERIRDGELGPPQAETGAAPPPPVPPPARPEPRAPAPSPPLRPAGVTPPGPTPLQGERRIITALLADVQGSTALAGQIDVELWVEIMNRVFQVLGAEIYRYGGEIDQYRGDGLVAFFGAQATHEDDPERAVLAGLAMQEAVLRYASELTESEGVELSLRVGVNTGEVIAASVGDSRQHREETAMGRAIALAARMETACEPGTVLVSEETYRLVSPLFQWQSLGQISVKGYDEPVAVYRPLAHRGQAGKGRGIKGLESPLVGRDGEFRTLREAVERLGDGLGGIVTLVGEAGLGKSRLVAEIRKLALRSDGTFDDERSANLQSPNLQWVEGRCLSYATGVAYGLWIDMLRALLGTGADAAPDDVRRRLREWVQALCPDCVDQVYPYLGRVLSLPLEEEAAAHLRGIEAQGLKVLTFRAVETAVQRATQERPLVVVCEDLHWADATSLELLERLLPLSERAPLLLVCVLRPEREHGCWQVRETAAREYPHRHSDLWLAPLSQAESGELVRNLLRVEELPEALRARVLERGEGNPFYVEEILRALIDQKIVVHDATVVHDEGAGRWRATRAESSDSGDEIPIPDTLQGVLRARIDRLPEEARRVLRTASVIGRIFSYRVLEAVVGIDAPLSDLSAPGEAREGPGVRGETLDTHLLTLQREQMIREQARLPERQFAFKHYLTVEAAYGGILRRERRVTHRRVAEVLERLYPERGSQRRGEGQLGLLARHWEAGGERTKAAGYLERAGAQAASQFANQEALGYLTRALDLTPDEDLLGRYRLLLTREAIHHLQGTRSSQRADLLALRELARALDDGRREATRRRAEVALREAKYLQSTGDSVSAAASFEEAIRLAQVAQDRSIEAAGHLLAGPVGGESHDTRVARFERALALARAAHDKALEAESLRELGLEFMRRGEYARAIAYQEQTLRIYREIGNRMGEGRALNGIGMVYLKKGDNASAKSYSEQGLALCRETGNWYDEAFGLDHLFELCMHEGDYARALAHCEQVLRILREIGDPGMEQVFLGWVGTLYRRLGHYDRALELYEGALHSPYAGGSTQAQALAWKGQLLHDTGDDALARGCCERSLSIIDARDRPLLRARWLTYLGHALAGLGHLAEAKEVYREALALFRDLGLYHLSKAPLSGLAHVALAGGRPAQALAYAEELLSYLDLHPALDVLGELFRQYLTCYRVLRAVEDPRAAEVLSRAHHLLQEWADKIDDQDLRRSFLENVAVNCEIVWEFTRNNDPAS